MKTHLLPAGVRRRAKQLLGRWDPVNEMALRVSNLERQLVHAKNDLSKAGQSTETLSEPWVLLDYEPKEIRIVASAWKRKASVAKEPETVAWIEETFRAGDVFYDVGANVGAYTLVAAVTQQQSSVFAFEPGYETYAALCKNVILNGVGDRVTALPVALTGTSGLIEFQYQRLGVGDAQHHIGSGAPFNPAFTQQLMGFRLDDLALLLALPEPTHLKVDVDGAELSVLAGAERVLASPALRELQVEVGLDDDGRIERVLDACGFAVADRHQTRKVTNVRFSRIHGSLTEPG